MGNRPGRTTRQHAINRTNLKAQQLPCWICKQPIDYTITDTTDPMVFEVDHVLPLKTHPNLAEDPNNLRPAHRKCNSLKRARLLNDVGQPSQNWL